MKKIKEREIELKLAKDGIFDTEKDDNIMIAIKIYKTLHQALEGCMESHEEADRTHDMARDYLRLLKKPVSNAIYPELKKKFPKNTAVMLQLINTYADASIQLFEGNEKKGICVQETLDSIKGFAKRLPKEMKTYRKGGRVGFGADRYGRETGKVIRGYFRQWTEAVGEELAHNQIASHKLTIDFLRKRAENHRIEITDNDLIPPVGQVIRSSVNVVEAYLDREKEVGWKEIVDFVKKLPGRLRLDCWEAANPVSGEDDPYIDHLNWAINKCFNMFFISLHKTLDLMEPYDFDMALKVIKQFPARWKISVPPSKKHPQLVEEVEALSPQVLEAAVGVLLNIIEESLEKEEELEFDYILYTLREFTKSKVVQVKALSRPGSYSCMVTTRKEVNKDERPRKN